MVFLLKELLLRFIICLLPWRNTKHFKLQLGPGKLLCPHSVLLTWMMFPTYKDFSIWIHLQIWPSRHNLSLCQENKSTLKKRNFIYFSSEFPPGLCSLWKEKGYEIPRMMGVLGSVEEPSARNPVSFWPHHNAAFWVAMPPFLHRTTHENYLSCTLLSFIWGNTHTHICMWHAFAICGSEKDGITSPTHSGESLACWGWQYCSWEPAPKAGNMPQQMTEHNLSKGPRAVFHRNEWQGGCDCRQYLPWGITYRWVSPALQKQKCYINNVQSVWYPVEIQPPIGRVIW